MADSLKELARGFRKRTLVTAKLAGRMGMKMAGRALGGPTDRPVEPASREALERTRELVAQLGAMKGLVMKVGQMASYLPGTLPPEVQTLLSDLQSASTAMEYSRVAEVLEAELGRAPDDLFEAFEREPFAAASIGQVHRARFAGRTVAVKVQYPGIEEVLASDLSTFRWLAKVSMLGLPLEPDALVDELRARILEECDYGLEARQQRELGALIAEDGVSRVPSVVAERSSRRVLTTELVEGLRFGEFVTTATQAAKDRAGEAIFASCFRCLFEHGVYNGDPHPGNYLFTPDGAVTFLDFGCVRRFDAPFLARWKAFARTILEQDRAAFPARMRALGLVGRERSFDYDHQWIVTQHLYRPFLDREPFFTFEDEYVRRSYGIMIFDNPNQRRTAMPPEWLLLNRLQWGLYAVLAKLHATAPWPEHFRRSVEAPFRGGGG